MGMDLNGLTRTASDGEQTRHCWSETAVTYGSAALQINISQSVYTTILLLEIARSLYCVVAGCPNNGRLQNLA